MDAKETVITNKSPLLLKDNLERAKSLVLVFWLFCAVTFVSILLELYELSLLKEIEIGNVITDSRADFSDISIMISGLLQVLFYIATIVVFLNWFRRAYGNLKRIKIRTESDETMAIWSFFIPIYNLFKPYNIMREIWEKSQQAIKKIDASYLFNKNAYLIGLWWFLFIVSGILDRASFKLSLKQDTIEQLITGTQVSLLSEFLSIIEAIVVIYMVKNISQIESVLAKKVKTLSVEEALLVEAPKKKVKFRGE